MEQRDPAERSSSDDMESRGGMMKTPIALQDLRQRIYDKAKAEPDWRFWGLYVHVCREETLRTAYEMARENNGAPGIDGVTFEAIEREGRDEFLRRIRDELVSGTYMPMRNRRKEIPKGNGKVRVLGIPTIRDRVVQGALKLILEPIFEADFQDGSYGYRPGRRPQEAVNRVANAIAYGKTMVIDLDLKSYFDNIRHHIVFRKVAERVNDDRVMHLLKLLLKANGKRGVPQGGVISPLIANIYLNELDQGLEQLKEDTTTGGYTHIEYARFADDVVVLVNGLWRYDSLVGEAKRRIEVELGKIEVEINREKTRIVNLALGESFEFLGFEFRRVKSKNGKWRPDYKPRMKSRVKVTQRIREICRENRSQPVAKLIGEINPVLRGWVNYFRIGNSSRDFRYVRDWTALKVRRHMMRAKGRKGFGWKRWSTRWLYEVLGLYRDYTIRYYRESQPSDRSHNPWRRSGQESPVRENRTPGSNGRGVET